MEFENKKLRDVAEVAARIMMGEKALHPNQQKLDVHEPEKDELTSDDFKKLRSMKKEELDLEEEQLDELSVNKMLTYRSKATEKLGSDPSKDVKRKEGIRVSGEKVKAKVTGMKKEEVEQIEEMFPGTPEYEKKYGKAPQDMKKGEKKKTSQGEMEKTGKGVVHRRKFSEMVESYTEGGVKSLFKTLAEEPTSAEFDAEIKKAQAKSEGKEKADVAKGAVQAVQNEETHTTVEFIDYNDVNGVKVSDIDLAERKLTDAESDKKEEIVKSMKKGLSGFKERYGKDAKSVMYATATARAKGE